MSLWARLGIVVLLQTVALAAMIGMKQYTLNTGTPIILETEPVDPRSLFSGDYVQLNYTVNRLRPAQLGGDDSFDFGDRIHVVLERRGDFWEPVSLYRAFPAVAAGQVVLKGRVEFSDEELARLAGRPLKAGPTLHVAYGIENYFVPEGEGRDLERPRPGEVLSIRVVVDKRGQAGIQAVLVNGKERYVESLF